MTELKLLALAGLLVVNLGTVLLVVGAWTLTGRIRAWHRARTRPAALPAAPALRGGAR
jgi:hypothetical protein